MSVCFKTNNLVFEVGSASFLAAFFDTIDVRLTKGIFGKKYPVILNEFYRGRLSYENLDIAEKELINIQKRLKKMKPSKIVWNKYDLDKKPPWGNNISSDITDLSNYFVTSDGQDLFHVFFNVIESARKEKSDIVIE